jgi:hypothetical protein
VALTFRKSSAGVNGFAKNAFRFDWLRVATDAAASE